MPHSRPHSPLEQSRSLRLTDLPTEILYQIFDHFKDARSEKRKAGRVDWIWDQSCDGIDVKQHAVCSSRLACRRLHQIASPLLLPTVRVKLEQGSLNRLDEISRIPEIASGVRGLEVHLAYCSEAPCQGLPQVCRASEGRDRGL